MPPRACNPHLHVAAAALVAACAAPGAGAARHPQEVPEVLVEVLPRDATLEVDGVPLGAGPRTVPVPDPARRYLLRASAPGFAPRQRADEGARLAGARVDLVLRPDGMEDGRLDLDDAEGLTEAAAVLERAGRHAEAAEYARRAVEAAPALAPPHRILGDAALAGGDADAAARAYADYLRLAPGAPDGAAVAARLERLREAAGPRGVERR